MRSATGWCVARIGRARRVAGGVRGPAVDAWTVFLGRSTPLESARPLIGGRLPGPRGVYRAFVRPARVLTRPPVFDHYRVEVGRTGAGRRRFQPAAATPSAISPPRHARWTRDRPQSSAVESRRMEAETSQKVRGAENYSLILLGV